MSDKPKTDKKHIDPVALNIMLGRDVFEAQGKKYHIRSLKLKMVDEFIGDHLSIGAQLFNFTTPEAVEKLEKWLPRVLFRDSEAENGVTLKEIIEEDWDLADLRRLWRSVLELSG